MWRVDMIPPLKKKCCCCPTEPFPDQLRVTFAGVDATVCGVCNEYQSGSPFTDYWKSVSASLDGVYTVNKWPSSFYPGSAYYRLLMGEVGLADTYSDAACSSLKVANNSMWGTLGIFVNGSAPDGGRAACQVQQILIGLGRGVHVSSSYRIFEAGTFSFSDTGGTFGEAISNERVCGTSSQSFASGGTVTIERI